MGGSVRDISVDERKVCGDTSTHCGLLPFLPAAVSAQKSLVLV